jgi:hypothetical protein
MRKRDLRVFYFCWIFIFFIVFYFSLAQEEKRPIEFSYSKADLAIKSSKKMVGSRFAEGCNIMDLNKDGIKDFIVSRAHVIQYNSFIFYDGKDLRNKKLVELNTYNLSLGQDSEYSLFRPHFEADINGDGFDDLFVVSERPAFFVFFSASEFFSKKIPDFNINKKKKRSKIEKKKYPSHLHIFSDVIIYDSDFSDFDKFDKESKINWKILDINSDTKNDILIATNTADFRDTQTGKKKKNVGKIFIVYGKQQWPKDIDLKKDADVTLVGDIANCRLGEKIFLGKVSIANENKIVLFLHQKGRVTLVPNITQLSGINVISEIPGVIKIYGDLNILAYNDFNGDAKPDIIFEKAAYPQTLAIILGKEEQLATKRSITDITDISIVLNTGRANKSISVYDITDYNEDGKVDAIFDERQKKGNTRTFYFVSDIFSKGKNSQLMDIIDKEKWGGKVQLGDFSFMTKANLNNNDIMDTIIVDADATIMKYGKKLKDCGKVYIFFDKQIDFFELNEDNLLKLLESADIIISGNNKNEYFGSKLQTNNIDGDNIDDIIIPLPGKFPLIIKKMNLGAVYVFYGKTLSELVKSE